MLNHNFRQLTDLFNFIHIRATHIFHREVGTEWNFTDYCDNFNRVYIIKNGEGVLYNEKEHIVMKPGKIYIIPANFKYSCRCDNYMEKFFIHFTATIIPQKDLLSGIGRIIELTAEDGEIEEIEKMLYCETAQSALLLSNQLNRLLIKLVSPDTGTVENDIAVYRKYATLYQYIENNLYADLTVAEVCRHIGFSQTYIGQRFKADTGNTIKSFITNALIEKLKQMLLSTNAPIGGIAEDLRFDSESYCSKFFKKHMGISPSKYRNICKIAL